MVQGLAVFATFASIAFYLFLGWVALSHVKEMRRQSMILAKIAKALEHRNAKD